MNRSAYFVIAIIWTAWNGSFVYGQTETAVPDKVIKVTCDETPSDQIGLGRRAIVEIDGEFTDPAKVQLFLDGKPVPNATAEVQDKRKLRFLLSYPSTQEEKEFWDKLLRPAAFQRDVSVSVGVDKPILPFTMQLIVVPRERFVGWSCFFLVILILFLWLARNSNILRESGPQLEPGVPNAYSLGRTQMAFWTFMVVSSFILIWLIDGSTDTLTTSAVTLIGISSGTALGAYSVDVSKSNTKQEQLEQLQKQYNTLQAEIEQLPAQISAADAIEQSSLKQQLRAKEKQATELEGKMALLDAQSKPVKSRGFFIDLLSDGGGVSMHRFQMLVWTLVIGAVFVRDVWVNLAMPEFNNTLMALMGVSSGTYVGFKFPEQSTAKAEQ